MAKKHKCTGCGKTRLDKYMVADSVWTTKTGKQRATYQCGDCQEENRGRKKSTK